MDARQHLTDVAAVLLRHARATDPHARDTDTRIVPGKSEGVTHTAEQTTTTTTTTTRTRSGQNN